MGFWDSVSKGIKNVQKFAGVDPEKLQRYKEELAYKDAYELREIVKSEWSPSEKKYAAMQLLRQMGESSE